MLTPEMFIASFLVILLSDANIAALLFFAWSRVKISVADTSRPRLVAFFTSSMLNSFSIFTSSGDTYFDFSKLNFDRQFERWFVARRTSWALFSWESAKIVISSGNSRFAMVRPSILSPCIGSKCGCKVVYKDEEKDGG